MDLNKLGLGDKIAGACGIVLIIDLLILPWHRVCISFLGQESCGSANATESPGGIWGILALLLTIAIVALVILDRLTSVELPELPIPWNQAIFYGCIATLVVLLLKLILETDYLGYGAWLAILLGAGMTYGGFLISKEESAPSAGGTTPPQAF